MRSSRVIDYEKESGILKVLGHPVRLKMVVELSKGTGCNVNEIVANLGVPQSTVSQHLGILKNQGIITSRKEGVKTCYSVVNRKVLKIISILEENNSTF